MPKHNKKRTVQPSIRNKQELTDVIVQLLPTVLQRGDDIEVNLSSVLTRREIREATLVIDQIIHEYFKPLLDVYHLTVGKSGLHVGLDGVLRGRIQFASKR